MVDLRPLLFINALLAMLLVAAGFVHFDFGQDLKAQSQTAAQSKQHTAQHADASKTTSTNTSSTANTDAKTALESEPAISTAQNDAIDQGVPDSALFKEESAPRASSQATAEAAAIQPTTTDKPIATAATSQPKPKQVIKTGKLIVRSNVYEDTVLVNGKPYGSTMIELNLTPGSYTIEVAKAGYTSWKTTADVRRGQVQTLSASLQSFNKVKYLDGVWENDIKTGEGSYAQSGKLSYQGSFVDGKFHGKGAIRYTNGTKYQGDWFEGQMKGRGTLTTAEGDSYIGELDNGQYSGDGTLTTINGDIYTGYWLNGELNGQGSLTTRDGLLYVGGFAENLFHGKGSLTYPNGGHYEGSFSNGLFHGKGIEVYPDGKKYVGQFIEGLYHGKGEILNPNGSKITGTFKDGEPFGKATLTTAEGEVFTARSSEPGVCFRLKSYRATECPKLEGW